MGSNSARFISVSIQMGDLPKKERIYTQEANSFIKSVRPYRSQLFPFVKMVKNILVYSLILRCMGTPLFLPFFQRGTT